MVLSNTASNGLVVIGAEPLDCTCTRLAMGFDADDPDVVLEAVLEDAAVDCEGTDGAMSTEMDRGDESHLKSHVDSIDAIFFIFY